MTERSQTVVKPPHYTVRLMEENEIPEVMSIFKDIGMGGDAYTLSAEIIRCWYTVDKNGFYVAMTDDGLVLGLCAAIRQNDDLVFIGCYGVKRHYHNLGIGINIWKKMLEDLGPLNCAVNSAAEMFEECKDIGCFPIVSKWNSSYWYSNSFNIKSLCKSIPHVTIREVKPEDLNDIMAYDTAIVGFERPNIVSTILWDKESFAIVAMVEEGYENFSQESKLDENIVDVEPSRTTKLMVCGYGCIKLNMVQSAVICPLYADTGELAELMVTRLVSNFAPAKDKGVCLMITEKNENAMILASKMKMSKFVALPRLWRRAELVADFGKIFGQYSLDFSVF